MHSATLACETQTHPDQTKLLLIEGLCARIPMR